MVLLCRCFECHGRYCLFCHNEDFKQFFEVSLVYQKGLIFVAFAKYSFFNKVVDTFFKLLWDGAKWPNHKWDDIFSPAFSAIWQYQPSVQCSCWSFLFAFLLYCSQQGMDISLIWHSVSFVVLVFNNTVCLKIIVPDYLWFAFFFHYAQWYGTVPFVVDVLTIKSAFKFRQNKSCRLLFSLFGRILQP